MKFYSIPKTDGGVAIMQTDGDPRVEVLRWHQDEIAKVNPDGIVEIDPSAIPNDRTFRGAWRHDLGIDMDKARDIHRDKLRRLREPVLAALDIELSRAFNDAAKQSEIEAKRQALRDVTADPAIDAAKTPEELKTVIPGSLV
jgi:hypothetical protein